MGIQKTFEYSKNSV